MHNHYLPDYTPEIALIRNDHYLKNNYFITGSKILANYTNFIECRGACFGLKAMFNNNPIVNQEIILFVSHFLGETDFRESNIGLIQNDKNYSLARVDFDRSFHYFRTYFKEQLLSQNLINNFQVNPYKICKAAHYVLSSDFKELAYIIDSAYQDILNYAKNKIDILKVYKGSTVNLKDLSLFQEGFNINDYLKFKLNTSYTSLQKIVTVCNELSVIGDNTSLHGVVNDDTADL